MFLRIIRIHVIWINGSSSAFWITGAVSNQVNLTPLFKLEWLQNFSMKAALKFNALSLHPIRETPLHPQSDRLVQSNFLLWFVLMLLAWVSS